MCSRLPAYQNNSPQNSKDLAACKLLGVDEASIDCFKPIDHGAPSELFNYLRPALNALLSFLLLIVKNINDVLGKSSCISILKYSADISDDVGDPSNV